MTDLKFLYVHALAWLLPSIYPFLLGLAVVIAITPAFGFSPPEFTQASLHLLDHFSAPTPTLFPLLLLFLLCLLSSNTLVMVPPLSPLLAGLLTIFSPPAAAILHLVFLIRERVSFSVFSIFGIEHTDAQLSARLLHTTSIPESQ